MISYSVILAPSAQKDLDCYSGKQLDKFEKSILQLYNIPRPHNARKLVGSKSQWRLRIGSYRILYEINDSKKEVRIYKIAHRKEVYR